MGTYRIEKFDLLTSIKDIIWMKILNVEGYQQHTILLKHFQWHENNEDDGGSYSAIMISPNTVTSMMDQIMNIMDKTFPYIFVYKYMI